MLLVHLFITTFAHSGRIPYLQEENVVHQNHVYHKWVLVCRSTILTGVGERFIGSRGKQPHNDVVEVGPQKSLSCSRCDGTR